jgi:hypothetical protein
MEAAAAEAAVVKSRLPPPLPWRDLPSPLVTVSGSPCLACRRLGLHAADLCCARGARRHRRAAVAAGR